MAKEIPLKNGGFAIVDDADYELVSRFNWTRSTAPWQLNYVQGYALAENGVYYSSLHRFLLQAPPRVKGDHINRNPLDNRRCNLRLASDSVSAQNRGIFKSSTSGYRGVGRHIGRWRALITKDGKTFYLGRFVNPEDAARAYDKAARELYGSHAFVNFPEVLP